MRHSITLRDGDLCLAPLEISDVSDRYVAWLNDARIVAQTEQAGLQHDADSVRAYVEANLRASDALIWRIVAAGIHVGNLRLSRIHEIHRRAAIGLIIGESSARGRGIGACAIRLAANHGLGGMGLNKISAGLYATNLPSRTAFERAGFHLEAVLRRHAWHQGHFIDILQMAKFGSDPVDDRA